MRYIVYIIIIGALVALTFGLFSVWGWHGLVPNFLLLVIISFALAFHNYDYLFFAFLGGIWFDILYGLPLGSFSIPFLLIGLGSSMIFQKFLFTEVSWQHFILTVAVATVALNLWLWFYTNMLFSVHWGAVAVSGSQLLRITIPELIANVVLAYPVYAAVELIAQSSFRLKKNRINL